MALEIRRVRAQDAPSLLELERAIVRDGRGVVRVESDLPTLERMRARIEGDGIHLVVLEGERVVGEGSVSRHPATLLQHVGMLSMGIHPDAQRRGLGKRLLEELIDRSRAAGVVRLELYTRADNHRAQALYRSRGFALESVRRRLVRLTDGTYVDDFIMVRFLDE